MVPILLWKADIATNSSYMWDQVMQVLRADAICCVEKETFLVQADGTEPGPDGAVNMDAWRFDFRGWMFAPMKQQYVGLSTCTWVPPARRAFGNGR